MIFLKQIHQIYLDQLSDIYPKQEISAIFYQLTAHFDQINRLDASLDPNIQIKKADYLYYLSLLKENVPLQYITGITNFYDLTIKVNKNVLIPRPETEELVDWIITDNKQKNNINILDIGTGSGVIAISLAKHLNANVSAIDISDQALQIASYNAKKNKVKVFFDNKDILQVSNAIQGFDIVVSNPPYVLPSEKKLMRKNVLNYEPKLALFVPQNAPLLFYKKIIELNLKNSNENSLIYFEINENLKDELARLLDTYNLYNYQFKKDIYGKWRMLKIAF